MTLPLDRRAFLGAAAGALALAATPGLALTQSEAERFISSIADELEGILRDATPQNKQVGRVLALLRRSAALPEIAQFTMGVNWRRMDEAQRRRFLDAFEDFAAKVYAENFEAYEGQTLDVAGSQDAGQRGIVVRSVIRAPRGGQDIRVDWLVSDRGGRPQIVDVIGEGVSLAITQREEFASMVERRGGDLDRFISDLESGL